MKRVLTMVVASILVSLTLSLVVTAIRFLVVPRLVAGGETSEEEGAG
jgi:hypothetical protein